MVWMQVEGALNPGRFLLVCGSLQLPLVAFVWWYAGWENGLGIWFATTIAAGIAGWFVAAWRVPSEARPASKSALAEFKKLHPTDTVVSVAVRAVQPGRFVFSIRYQPRGLIVKPPRRRYFAVTRTDVPFAIELDARDWPVYGKK
jgi:hypothetical protein